jgi:hypothetical protein
MITLLCDELNGDHGDAGGSRGKVIHRSRPIKTRVWSSWCVRFWRFSLLREIAGTLVSGSNDGPAGEQKLSILVD